MVVMLPSYKMEGSIFLSVYPKVKVPSLKIKNRLRKAAHTTTIWKEEVFYGLIFQKVINRIMVSFRLQ